MRLINAVVVFGSNEEDQKQNRGDHCVERAEADEKHSCKLRESVAFSEHNAATHFLAFWFLLVWTISGVVFRGSWLFHRVVLFILHR